VSKLLTGTVDPCHFFLYQDIFRSKVHYSIICQFIQNEHPSLEKARFYFTVFSPKLKNFITSSSQTSLLSFLTVLADQQNFWQTKLHLSWVFFMSPSVCCDSSVANEPQLWTRPLCFQSRCQFSFDLH
jgi:hypothetical protein